MNKNDLKLFLGSFPFLGGFAGWLTYTFFQEENSSIVISILLGVIIGFLAFISWVLYQSKCNEDETTK